MTAAPGTILISHEQIRRRIAEMGRQISRTTRERTVTFVAILKGSFIFLADLIRAISPEIPVEIDFMSVSSYGDATSTSGTIHIEKDAKVEIDGRTSSLSRTSWTPVSRCFTFTNPLRRGARTSARRPCWKTRQLEIRTDTGLRRISNSESIRGRVRARLRATFRNLPDIRVLDEV